MNRQDLHNMDLVFCSEEEVNIECRKEMQGTGVLIDGTTFQFILNGKRCRNRNRIVYKGRALTCHLRKDGRYGVSLYVEPGCDLTDTLRQVHNEMKAVFNAIREDVMIKEASHEV